MIGRWDSLFVILIRPRARRLNGSVSIPCRTKIFFSFSKRPDRIWCSHRLLCSRYCGESPSRAKQPGLEADHTSLSEVLFNPLNAELNPICYLLALLGAHHFLHVSRIRVKSLTIKLLMSYIYKYIYMEHLFLMFLDHTQRRSTVGRTPLDE